MNKLNDSLLAGLLEQYGVETKCSAITVENNGKKLFVRYPSGSDIEDRMEINFSDSFQDFSNLNAFYQKASKEAKSYKRIWKNEIHPNYFFDNILLKDKKFHDMPAERKLLQKTEGRLNGKKCGIEIQNYWPMEGSTNGSVGVSVLLAGKPDFAENLFQENAVKDIADYLGICSLKKLAKDAEIEIDKIPDFMKQVKGGEYTCLQENFPSKTERDEGYMDITKNLHDGEKNISYVSFNILGAGQAREIIRKLSPIIKEPSGYSLDFSVFGTSEGYHLAGCFMNDCDL